MNTETERRRAWCYFRNLVHTTYREARHVGPSGDRTAKLCLPDNHLLTEAAKRCSSKRDLLKGTSLFEQTAAAKSVDDVVQPYRDATGLDLADLVSLFSERDWAPGYGGQKWVEIARTAAQLAEALNAGDLEAALKVCAKVQHIRHNSGRLVPSLDDWRSVPYQREKWPELCV